MFETFFSKIIITGVALVTMIVSAFTPTSPISQESIDLLNNSVNTVNEKLGAAIPTPVAFFETSLSSKITASDTSMTLVSTSTKNGYLTTGSVYGFVIDEGTADEEIVSGTVSGSSVTGMSRGLDPVTGNTEVTALKKAHRRGASVKITDAPTLLVTSRILNGIESVPNALYYSSSSASFITSSTQLTNKAYVDSVAYGTSTYWLPTGSDLYYGGSGNVGIGTIAPTSKLHLVGNFLNTGTSTISGNATVGGTLGVTGISTIGGLLNFGAIATNTPYSVFINEPALHTLAFNTAGSEAMRINSSGYIGIGTTTPSVSLHVVGSSIISNNFNVGGILNVTGNSIFSSGISVSGFATSTAGFNNASKIGQRSFTSATATTTVITTTFKPSKVYLTGGFGAAYSSGHGSSSGFANLTEQRSSYGSACNAGGSDTYAFYYLTTRNFSGSPCDSAASVTVTIASSSVILTESGSTDSGTAAYTYLIQ